MSKIFFCALGSLIFVVMSDLALYRRNDGCYDLDFDASRGDLSTTEGLENAVVISLGTNARERKLGRNANLKPCVGGWWGDALDELGTLGGYLYEAFSGKLAPATSKQIETLVKEALQWMVDDGIASSIECVATAMGKTTILEIVLKKPDGDKAFMYELNWRATDAV